MGCLPGCRSPRRFGSRTRPARSSPVGSAAPTTCRRSRRWSRCARLDEARVRRGQRRARRSGGARAGSRGGSARGAGGRDLRNRPPHRGGRVPERASGDDGPRGRGIVLAGGGFEGTRVVSETYFSTCRTCDFCLAGRPNLCLDRRSIGTHVDGAFAARLVVPLANLHPVPDWLPDHAAVLTEPLACVCNALFDPPVVAPGDAVLVLGPGAIGLLAAQAVRAAGGRVTVVGTERDGARLELASKLGLQARVAATQSPLGAHEQAVPVAEKSASVAATQSRFDVVVECSGPRGRDCQRASGDAARRAVRPDRAPRRLGDGAVGRDRFRELVVTSGFASTPASCGVRSRSSKRGLSSSSRS